MNKTIKEILNIIKKFDVITIYGHINPDPDAFGSTLALRELIRDNFPHKKVYSVGLGQERFHERLGKYVGSTVKIVPHISEEIVKLGNSVGYMNSLLISNEQAYNFQIQEASRAFKNILDGLKRYLRDTVKEKFGKVGTNKIF